MCNARNGDYSITFNSQSSGMITGWTIPKDLTPQSPDKTNGTEITLKTGKRVIHILTTPLCVFFPNCITLVYTCKINQL